MKNIKVLHLIHWPCFTFALNLAKNRGGEDIVYAMEDGLYPFPTDYKNLVLYSKNFHSKISTLYYWVFPLGFIRSIKAVFKIKKTMKENDIRIIHCHFLPLIYLGIILRIITFGKIKVILNDHGFTVTFYPNNPAQKSLTTRYVMMFFLKFISLFLDKIITSNDYGTNYLIEKLNINSKKVEKIINFYTPPVNTDNSNINQYINDLKIDKDRINIGFLGRLEKIHKGWDVFVDAAKILLKKYDNINFIIGGDGPDKDELLKSINGIDNIYYLDWVKNLPSFYSMLSIFVLPSNHEACPLVISEAMSYNVPVIVSDAIGVSDNIIDGHNGLLIERGNYQDLAGKIELLLNDKDVMNKVKSNIPNALKLFSFETYNDKLNKLYDSLLK